MKSRGGKSFVRVVHGVFTVLVLYMMLPVFAFAEQSEDEKNFLLMYFKEEELQVVSSTRSIKSISHVAENMTVVTARDIERMNAHTLADVLNTVNGVQVWFGGTTPGNIANVFLQGSDERHVTVLIDGIVQNNLTETRADIGIIPVQNIEKIEIVKGPASSAWGSALGGIINIITKSPSDKGVHGTASVSYGSNNTEDYRAEVSGKTGNAGFYLSAGQLHSNGFRPAMNVLNDNLYAKLTYDITNNTDINLSSFYLKSHRGRGDFVTDVDRDRSEQYFGTLTLNSRINNKLDLSISAYSQRQRLTYFEDFVGGDLASSSLDERRYGGSAKLIWKPEDHLIVVGSEYDNGTAKNDALVDGEQHLKKFGFFANDTITVGKFAFTPGVRYDYTSTNGGFTSPSLGATYLLTKKTILRATVARGFDIPPLSDTFYAYGPNPALKLEKVMSYQVGAESGELNYVWLKVSLFRHDVKDFVDETQTPTINNGPQRRQGFEAEVRTVPVYNTTLSAGTTYVYAKNPDTNEVIKAIPQYTYDVALAYDDKKSFRALLKGRYVWWNADRPDVPSKYSSVIVDLSMTKTLYKHADQRVEAFFVAHNLFDGSQYLYSYYQNAGRWAEVGVRYKF